MKTVEVPPLSEVQPRMFILPPFRAPHITKTLIFDMDETLIHCVDDPDLEKPHHLISIQFEDELVTAGINIRPFLYECLTAARQRFQIGVFTASHQSYADAVLDFLDPKGELFDFRLYRDSCHCTPQNVYIKDLRIFANQALKDLVIVDNAVYSFGFQLENGIPIIPYYDAEDDEELFHLIPYLEILAECEDVRVQNREAF